MIILEYFDITVIINNNNNNSILNLIANQQILHTYIIQYNTLIPWLDWLAMKGGMGSIPFCSEFWLNVVLVVNGVDLEDVTKFIFAFKMYGVP